MPRTYAQDVAAAIERGKRDEVSEAALRVLRAMAAAEGEHPSVRTLVEALGLSGPRAVHFHLIALEVKGYTERTAEAGGRQRRWRITQAGRARALYHGTCMAKGRSQPSAGVGDCEAA